MTTAAADPKARELDEAFAVAMSGPAKPRSEPKTPPEIDPEAPFGRDDQGQPIAKYGYRNDGTIRLTGAGRPSKNSPDQARVAETPASPAAAGDGPPAGDYTAALAEAADGIWLCMTAASKLPLGRLRLGGYGLPADCQDKIAAQAFMLSQHKYRLAAALNEAARHNSRARALAIKMADGDLSWVLTVGALALPFAFQSMALWKGDQALEEMEMPAAAELASRNDAAMAEFMESLKLAAAMIQQQADAQAAA